MLALLSFSSVCSPMKPLVTKASSPFFKIPRNSALLPFMRTLQRGRLEVGGRLFDLLNELGERHFLVGCRGLMSCHTKKKVKSSMAQTRMVL